MIHRYAYPLDNESYRIGPTVTASAEDSEYPAENLVDINPAKPAKLTTTGGNWILDFGTAIAGVAAALLYHNIDNGVTVTLQANSSSSWGSPPFSQTFTIPGRTEDDWTVSPWIEFASTQTYRYWRLLISGTANAQPIGVGHLMILSNLRTMDTDVRWGEEEVEEHGLIELPTELGVETIYALGGKRRRFSGELTLGDAEAAEFISLVRSAVGRIHPWLLIPDEDVNDAWIVRFEENRWQRQREIIDINNFPFRVQELSRGLPWP
jgi:hypothetical protein